MIKSFHRFTNHYSVGFEKVVMASADEMNSSSVSLHLGPLELNWKLAFSVR